MSLNRMASTAVGLCVLGIAVLVVVSPSMEDRLPIATAVARLGNDYLLVALLAGLALLAVLGILLVRTATGVTEATPPTVEEATPAVPGREVDAVLDSLSPLQVTDRHRRLHDRLRAAAITAVAESRHCSRADARELVDRCEWTDDAAAATFLADEPLDAPPIGRRLVDRLRGDDWFERRVRATVVALETLAGEGT